MKRIFITGTDTDSGKTYTTCKLLRYLNENEGRALGVKPIASGCQVAQGQVNNADAELLARHNPISDLNINPWRFELPVSPHLAAHCVNQIVTARDIADFCLSDMPSDIDYLLIEGAGGLMVPLNNHETWVDVLRLSHIPVILVVGMKLGCLNHALLTEIALSAHGCHLVGLIVNCLDPDMLMLEENIQTLNMMIKAPVLARIPYNGEIIPYPELKSIFIQDQCKNT